MYYLGLCLMTADTMIDAGQQYWEVRFDKESKAFAVGVALRSLGRFDQLGKSSASWCIHLNNWLQQSLTAKHNNKARTLDCPIPNSIGVYVNYDEGTLINTHRVTVALYILSIKILIAALLFLIQYKCVICHLYSLQVYCLSSTPKLNSWCTPSKPSSSSQLYQLSW